MLKPPTSFCLTLLRICFTQIQSEVTHTKMTFASGPVSNNVSMDAWWRWKRCFAGVCLGDSELPTSLIPILSTPWNLTLKVFSKGFQGDFFQTRICRYYVSCHRPFPFTMCKNICFKPSWESIPIVIPWNYSVAGNIFECTNRCSCLFCDMGVSKNRDTPKWMVYNGKFY